MKNKKHFLAENYERFFGKPLNESEQSVDSIMQALMSCKKYDIEESVDGYDFIIMCNDMKEPEILSQVEFNYLGVNLSKNTLSVRSYPDSYDEPGNSDVTGEIKISKMEMVDAGGQMLGTVPVSNKEYRDFAQEVIQEYIIDNFDEEEDPFNLW